MSREAGAPPGGRRTRRRSERGAGGSARRGLALAALAWWAAGAAGCDLLRREPPPPPSAEVAAAYFRGHAGVERVEVSGNVVVVYVIQPGEQITRGGALWVKVGPYIHLFSPGTRDLLEDHGGVAAVRVITGAPGMGEIARATLARDAMSDMVWRRGQGLLDRALREGTERPVRLEQLVSWAEQYVDFEYNPRYVRE